MTVVRRALTLLGAAAISVSMAGPATASLARGGQPAWACAPGDVAAAAAGQSAEARGPSTLVRDRDSGQLGRDLPRSA
jgi:hypothetical protein